LRKAICIRASLQRCRQIKEKIDRLQPLPVASPQPLKRERLPIVVACLKGMP
jgi:hypothetical protein